MADSMLGQIIVGLVVAAIAGVGGWSSNLIFLALSDWPSLASAPRLAPTFKTSFREINETNQPITTVETVNVRQFGYLVFGEIRSDACPDSVYKFKGKITRNVLTAQFRPKERRRNATGRGAFQLLLTKDDRVLVGSVSWFDSDSDKVESSNYVWTQSP